MKKMNNNIEHCAITDTIIYHCEWFEEKLVFIHNNFQGAAWIFYIIINIRT